MVRKWANAGKMEQIPCRNWIKNPSAWNQKFVTLIRKWVGTSALRVNDYAWSNRIRFLTDNCWDGSILRSVSLRRI